MNDPRRSKPTPRRPGARPRSKPFPAKRESKSKSRAPGGRLPREWSDELRGTVKPGRLDETTRLVAKALEAFAGGDFERAANLTAKAKEQAQRSSRVRELLGLAHYHAGDYRDAIRELLTYRRLTGRLDQNHVIADCYRATGRADRAIEICHEVSPDNVRAEVWTEVLIVAASTLADQGDLEKALAQTARLPLQPREIGPHHLRLWYVRADLLERAGRAREAAKQWERIIAEDPSFHDVAERLGKMRAR